MTRLGFTLLGLTSTLLLAPLALAQDTSVRNTENVRYLDARAQDRAYRDQVASDLGSQLQGDGEVRRVQFDYAKDGNEFPVRGVLVSFQGVKIERYRLANLREAVLFSDHDRTKEGRHLVEVRGRDVVVLSGRRTSSQRRTRALRKHVWRGAAKDRQPDYLEVNLSEADGMIRVTPEALQSSGQLGDGIAQIRQMATFMSTMPGTTHETLENGGFRLDTDGEILALEVSDDGTLVLRDHSSEAAEARLTRFFERVSSSPKSPAGSDSTGISGALTGAKALPQTLGASDAGSYRTKVGETFQVELKSNASTGYRWHVQAPNGVSLLARRRVTNPSGPVGSGGEEHFRFKVEQAGSHTLRLVYARTPDGTPAETFELTLTVGN